MAFDQKILAEKLKYLISMESSGKFEIFELDMDIDYESVFKLKDGERDLYAYFLYVKFDYLMPMSHDSVSFPQDFKNVIELFEKKYLSSWGLTRQGKIKKSEHDLVDFSWIDSIDYKFEERHIFTMTFKMEPVD
jgi:hypothetical protein